MSSTVKHTPAFVSLGMVVVDELRSPGNTPLKDVPGGSGAFATFGARLIAGKDQSQNVGCFILAGNDFPQSVLDRFKEWDIDMTVQVDAARLSTRGLLEYQDSAFSRKTFRYMTTPLQPTPKDLPPSLLHASAFHLLASPAQVETQVGELIRLRANSPKSSSSHRPLLVWEPLPIQVSADAKDAHMTACRHVDVFSPNHLELMTFFRGPVSEEEADDAHFSAKVIEEYADAFLEAGIGANGQGTIVVRAGSRGCLVASSQMEGRHHWLPAFSFGGSSAGRKVVDATGAGNTFLGAFTYALASHGNGALEAAKHATVAASFSLEQIGLAVLKKEGPGEIWNDDTFGRRYEEYKSRILAEA